MYSISSQLARWLLYLKEFVGGKMMLRLGLARFSDGDSIFLRKYY